MDNENEVAEAINLADEQAVETQPENVEETEDVEALKVKLAEALEAKRQLTARAKDAEAKLKNKADATQPLNNSLSAEDVEVRILKAQGMKQELIDELKVVAKARGKGILDTQSDPIFVAIKEQHEAQEKSQKAKLPASRGSSSVKAEKTFNTRGISDEDHKALWREKNGN